MPANITIFELGYLEFSSRLFISISVEQRCWVWPGLKIEQLKLLFSSFCFDLCFYPGQHFISTLNSSLQYKLCWSIVAFQ